ncbi:MAG: hypothetical protein JWP86_3033 [Phenylobacterium sp.]|nr:hypothetical protein [Phenylobacterium sp.]MDB5495696.1 hypothetical protein [Phenylobacterium sp.]
MTPTRSSRPPEAVLGALVLVAVSLAACSPGAPRGVDKDKLDAAVSDAIGDPASCLLIAEKATGKVVYRYNTATVCARQLPACQGQAVWQVKDLLAATVKDGQPRALSCNTTADASRGVSWASGVLPAKGLVYAAMMEGTRTFPGRMMAERIEPRLQDLGLK